MLRVKKGFLKYDLGYVSYLLEVITMLSFVVSKERLTHMFSKSLGVRCSGVTVVQSEIECLLQMWRDHDTCGAVYYLVGNGEGEVRMLFVLALL